MPSLRNDHEVRPPLGPLDPPDLAQVMEPAVERVHLGPAPRDDRFERLVELRAHALGRVDRAEGRDGPGRVGRGRR